MENEVKTFTSAVRRSVRYGVIHSLRRWFITRGLGALGEGVYVDRNVRILRYQSRVFLGNRVMLKEGVRICPAQPDADIRIGDWTTVGYHTFIFASASVRIGANCLVAPFCYLVDANHGIARGALIREQDMTASPIVIGEDVWLGQGVTVLAGVTIGKGAVVAARSVVNSDVPSYAIVAGAPATIKGYRE